MSQETTIPGADFAQEAMGGQPEGESPAPNWQAIEGAFRAGAQSLRGIAAANGLTEGAIRARAKKAGWTRGITHPATHPTPEDQADRIAALEDQVAELHALTEDMGALLEELASVNAGPLQRRRAPQAWKARDSPSRWG